MEATAVLVPMYDEATMIGGVVSGLREHFDRVLCVDDGSRDGSAEVAVAAGAEVVRHAVNLGQGAALRTGFELLLRDPGVAHVVTFDADGQHAAADAVAMVELARRSGVDVVLGSRAAGRAEGQPRSVRALLRLALWWSRRSTGLDLTDTHNGLRVLSRHAVRTLTLRQRGMAHASELEALVARHRLTWIEHPVIITYSPYSRAKGQSRLNAVNVLYDLLVARLGAL